VTPPVPGEGAAALQGEVRAWAALLETARAGLLRAVERIPPSPAEADPEVDLDALDLTTEVRSVARGVAEGYLRPAIDDLRSLLPEGER